MIALTAAAVVAGAIPAQAKISCEGVHPPAAIEVEGLPAELLANTEYHPRLEVPKAPPLNQAPVVMFARCDDRHDPGFAVNLPGAGEVEFPLRFSDAGRWRAILFDQGGESYSLGTFNVLPAASGASTASTVDEGSEGNGAAVLIGGIAVGGLGLALLTRHRRREPAAG